MLVTLLVITSVPIQAGELTGRDSILGSVRAVGTVQVRNVAVTRETTMFAGDQIHTGPKSYAGIAMSNGTKVQLISDSDLVVTTTKSGERGVLNSGTLSFAASQKPVAFAMGGFEVRPAPGASGVVSFIGSEFGGVRATTGSVTVVDQKTQKSMVVQTGTDRFINLKTGQMNVALPAGSGTSAPVRMAAALPGSAAGGAGAAQGGAAGGGGGGGAGLTTAMWVGIIAAVAGGVTALAIVATGCDEDLSASPAKRCD